MQFSILPFAIRPLDYGILGFLGRIESCRILPKRCLFLGHCWICRSRDRLHILWLTWDYLLLRVGEDTIDRIMNALSVKRGRFTRTTLWAPWRQLPYLRFFQTRTMSWEIYWFPQHWRWRQNDKLQGQVLTTIVITINDLRIARRVPCIFLINWSSSRVRTQP